MSRDDTYALQVIHELHEKGLGIRLSSRFINPDLCGIILAYMSAARARTPVRHHRIRLGHLVCPGEHRGDAFESGRYIRWHSKRHLHYPNAPTQWPRMRRKFSLPTRAARSICPPVSVLSTHQIMYTLRMASRSGISRDVREAFTIAFMSRTSDIPTPHRLAAASTLSTYFRRDSAHGNVAFDQATEFLEGGQSSPGSSVRWSVWR